jgi:hypothetical protein
VAVGEVATMEGGHRAALEGMEGLAVAMDHTHPVVQIVEVDAILGEGRDRDANEVVEDSTKDLRLDMNPSCATR